MAKESVPSPGELEKELNQYLSKKYGDRVKLSTPMAFPDTDEMHGGQEDKPPGKDTADRPTIKFTMKPIELEAYLNDYAIGQDSAKEILATKICTHFNRISRRDRSPGIGNVKNNILMIGPTGVGKTFLIKLIAQKIGVPFVKGDATKFSETGYVGGDVEDLVRDLVRESGGDIERAQYGIIHIDEIDKIAGSRNSWGLDVSRTGVQRALLKPMEETEVDLKVPHDIVAQMEALEQFRRTGKRERSLINTRNILFIMSGAFNDIDDIIEKRLNRQGLGFGAALRTANAREHLLREVKAEDLQSYGFESEFIGRLPVVAVFDPLSADDLYQILKSPASSVVMSKKKDFLGYGIDLRFDDEALRIIAEAAFSEKTGARGLISALERVLLKFEKALPSGGLKRLVVSPEMAAEPGAAFARIMAGDGLEQMDRCHAELVARDELALKTRMLARRESLDQQCLFLLGETFIDTIAHIASACCMDCAAVLEEAVLVTQEARDYEQAFFRYHNMGIHFTDQALNRLIERSLVEDVDAGKLLRELFSNYQHGLKLIRERTGRRAFEIDAQAINNPQDYLNGLIKDSYR
ncbi:MAG: AAA family ATPase [Proteobacteria bacterium]|nr:AAA family ATPase [Pseudomonadota bacterium]